MSNAREDLRLKICNLLITSGVKDAALEVDLILDKYEISDRTTEIALLEEDRNEYLFKKFIVAKTVNGCSERTIEFYTKTLKFVFQRIKKNVDSVTADDIRYYIAYRQKVDKVSSTTTHNEFRVLQSFYNYLLTEEIISKNPTLKVGSIKNKKTKKEAFSEIEIEKMRDVLNSSRERAIFEVLLSTGCRVSELVNIKISDIDENKVKVIGKGNKERIVYLNARAKFAVEKYLSERTDTNPYLFCGGWDVSKTDNVNLSEYGTKKSDWYKNPKLVSPSDHTDKSTIEQIIRRIKKRANLDTRCYPHKFRRTCATMALRIGMPIEQVSKMLGHNEISTTQIYLDLDDSELESAHKKYVM